MKQWQTWKRRWINGLVSRTSAVRKLVDTIEAGKSNDLVSIQSNQYQQGQVIPGPETVIILYI